MPVDQHETGVEGLDGRQRGIALIAALDQHRAIGRDGDLPWRLPDDLARFKALTMGRPMLMGRRTAQSLGRLLPGRRHLVLTRGPSVPFDGMELVTSVDDALRTIADVDPSLDLMVIGGAQLYALTLPRASRLFLTHVDTVVTDADTFFPGPPLFTPDEWRVVTQSRHEADDRHAWAFSFCDYERSDAHVVS